MFSYSDITTKVMHLRARASAGPSVAPAIGNRIIALMRLVLASSALLIIFIDPSQPDRLIALTYAVLSLYVVYSGILYVLALRSASRDGSTSRWAHWADVGWFTLLIALSSGTSSIFFFGFFFAVMVASFSHGFAPGLRVVLVSAFLFTVVGFVAAPEGSNFELNRFLLRPIYLLVLGYMVAYWGGSEITLKRRLALLKEIATLSNPRFGVDRTIGRFMERLRIFYDADTCMIITVDQATEECRLRRADRRDAERAIREEPIPLELAQQLLMLPDGHAVVYSSGPRAWWRSGRSYHAYDVATGQRAQASQGLSEALAAALDAESFVAVPLRFRDEAARWLYLTSTRRHAFNDSDVDFLLQVIDHFGPVIANIRLVDRLASDAADVERQRIARDLHDSVIQPYLGIQIGLTAIREKLLAGDAGTARDVERLIEQIGDEMADLRGYVRGLKSASGRESGLLASLRRFAAKFAEATGIAVQVEVADDLRLNDRLAAEVFQMVAEGLSNVRRHTTSRQATVILARHNDHMILRIEDDGTAEATPASFRPRSISERAAALGGQVRVEPRPLGGSAVIVEIPL